MVKAANLSIGAAIGYASSMAMDKATGWYLGYQSEASRRREEEVAPGGAPVLVGKKLARLVGRDVSDEGAVKIGSLVHRSLGMTYGMAAALTRKDVAPLAAGVATGATAFLVVDEAFLSAFFTPPPWAYPIESHLRGVVGHLGYGLAAGAMLSVARRVGAVRR